MNISIIHEYDWKDHDVDNWGEIGRCYFSDNLKGMVRDDLEVFILNNHMCDGNLTIPFLDCKMEQWLGEDNKDKKLLVVNWGYTNNRNLNDDNSIMDYLRDHELVMDRHMPIIKSRETENEYIICPKNGGDYGVASYVVTPKGYNILFIGVDMLHYTSRSLNYSALREIFADIIINRDTTIECPKYKASILEKKSSTKKEYLPFVSIASVVSKLSEKQKNQLVQEMLDKVDYNQICTLVTACISNSSPHGAKTDFLSKQQIRSWLEPWAINKLPFYLLFDKSFTISKDIKILKDEQAIRNELENLYPSFPYTYPILSSFHPQEFLNNKLTSTSVSACRYAPAKRGMKLSKYLSTLFHDNEFDLALSKIFQDNKIDTTLSISIDPYDYMTCSITKNNWRSCHNMFDGETKTGGLSFLFDLSTMVAYSSSSQKHDYDLGGYKFSGNSKSWRQMVHVDTVNNRLVFNREYPQGYKNTEITDCIRAKLESIIASFCGIDDNWIRKNNSSIKGITYNFNNNYAYDDIPARETILIKHVALPSFNHITSIGSEVLCPVCNKSGIRGRASMLCNRCLDKVFKDLSEQDTNEETDSVSTTPLRRRGTSPRALPNMDEPFLFGTSTINFDFATISTAEEEVDTLLRHIETTTETFDF